MTQHEFHPSPNWMESNDRTILSSSNPSLKLFVEFNEGGIPRFGAVHLKPVKESAVSMFLNVSSFHSMVLNECS